MLIYFIALQKPIPYSLYFYTAFTPLQKLLAMSFTFLQNKSLINSIPIYSNRIFYCPVSSYFCIAFTPLQKLMAISFTPLQKLIFYSLQFFTRINTRLLYYFIAFNSLWELILISFTPLQEPIPYSFHSPIFRSISNSPVLYRPQCHRNKQVYRLISLQEWKPSIIAILRKLQVL